MEKKAEVKEPEIMEVPIDISLLNRKLNVVIEMLEEVLTRTKAKRRPNNYIG